VVLAGRGGSAPNPAAVTVAKPTKPTAHHAATTTRHRVTKPTTTAHRPTRVVSTPAATPVMVLNANGVAGAAGTVAGRPHRLGYPTPVVTNAAHRGVPPTIMYAPGYGSAARTLASKIGGILYVTPLDGVKPSELHGAKLVVYVG